MYACNNVCIHTMYETYLIQTATVHSSIRLCPSKATGHMLLEMAKSYALFSHVPHTPPRILCGFKRDFVFCFCQKHIASSGIFGRLIRNIGHILVLTVEINGALQERIVSYNCARFQVFQVFKSHTCVCIRVGMCVDTRQVFVTSRLKHLEMRTCDKLHVYTQECIAHTPTHPHTPTHTNTKVIAYYNSNVVRPNRPLGCYHSPTLEGCVLRCPYVWSEVCQPPICTGECCNMDTW